MTRRNSTAAALALLVAAVAAPAHADLVSVMVDVSKGVDIGQVIKAAPGAGIELVMHRATLGTDTPDSGFNTDFRAIQTAGLLAGAYHLLYAPTPTTRVKRKGDVQARDFLKNVAGACKAGEPVLLALDWEKPDPTQGVEEFRAPPEVAEAFLIEVRKRTGVEPLVYSDRTTIAQFRSSIGQVVTQSPLWLSSPHRLVRFDGDASAARIADRTDQTLTIEVVTPRHDVLAFPEGADYAPWTSLAFWQFSIGGDNLEAAWAPITAVEPAIPYVDTSYFRGSREAFRAFFAAHAWKCDPSLATLASGA